MIAIHAEQPKDVLAIQEVTRLVFNNEAEANLVEAIRASECFVPGLALVAVREEDNEAIGHILFSLISIETEQGSIPTLALAPMAVLPDEQNHEIGSVLVREGLKACEALGYEHVVVLGHPKFYPKFGFVPASTKGLTPHFEVSDEVFMVYEIKPDSLPGVTGKVRYSAAFDEVS